MPHPGIAALATPLPAGRGEGGEVDLERKG